MDINIVKPENFILSRDLFNLGYNIIDNHLPGSMSIYVHDILLPLNKNYFNVKIIKINDQRLKKKLADCYAQGFNFVIIREQFVKPMHSDEQLRNLISVYTAWLSCTKNI